MAKQTREFVRDYAVVEVHKPDVAISIAEPFISARQEANQAIWSNADRWVFGFYFGVGDSRLWVPQRKNSESEKRVINFSHSQGRKAFNILMIGYSIGLMAVGLVTAALIGIRW